MSVTLSWINEPLECSNFAWVEFAEAFRDDVVAERDPVRSASRQSSGVVPVKRGPEADRFSSVPQVNVQWSTITSWAPACVENASSPQPPPLAWPGLAGAYADVLQDHVVGRACRCRRGSA